MANDINKEDPHYKGEYGSIYEVNRKFPTGGVAGDFVVIEGWAHYWNADRGTWCVNAERDSYWDELITNIIEKFKIVRGATYMGVASLDTVPTKAIGAKMYYFATIAGTYKNFGNLVVPQGINVLYSENGSSWVNTTLLEMAQELGVSTNKVVSQKTLNDALNLKANQSYVNEALAKKFDKQSVVQESGEAEDKVMSQKAVSDKLSDLADNTEIRDDENNVVKNPFSVINNPEYLAIETDAEGKVLAATYPDGSHYAHSMRSETIDALENQKVDKEAGKSLIDSEVAAAHSVIESPEYLAIETDAEDKVLAATYPDGSHYAHNMRSETIDALENQKVDKKAGKSLIDSEVAAAHSVIESTEYLAIETDAEDKVLAATYPDGSHYFYNMKSETIDALENMVSKINDDTKSLNDNVQNIIQKIETISREDVYSRNANNIPLLQSACRYNNGKKDFLMCIIADSHSEEQAVQNAVALTNKIDVIDAIIHCGDITATHFDKTQILNFYNDYKHCEKPWLIVIGNHDVGNTMYLQYSATHEEIFQYYIKPMIDGGILNNGEYQEGKPYYFHDFTDRKIRVIVPYEYDNPLDVADNEYWDSIDYDGSLPQLVPGKTYSVGDKVNSGGYKYNSFICKKEVVTINSQYDNNYTIPYYKSGRAARVIRKEQAEWLVNTLKSTPDEYGVIIATHNPAMLNSTNQINSKFAVDTAYKGVTQGQYAMETDLISEIVNAFIKKIQLSLKVVMKSANWYKADASYMNILGDTGEKYAYQIEADFSHIQNCYFACYVGGHSHKDLVFKHDTYESQYGINPVCASTNSGNRGQADIVNTNVDSLNYDALTCISVSKGRIALSRLGNQLSLNGKHRDIEIINI
ncbi:metallophosphoesterase family protein [Segatella copri]|uniref:metallophosphoesterase family protein n=2 Tax=Segatella copri TaxID=165179 RepID=UPI001C473B80|nr:metallophosphoesterase family protein [Segatella copri]MBW0045930.1 metallophosphoesterase [Segatella copri]